MKRSLHQIVGLVAIFSLLSSGCEFEDGLYIPENSVFVCNDNMDNDGNGLVDCEEPACQGFRACTGGGIDTGEGSDTDIDTGEPEVTVDPVDDLFGIEAKGIAHNPATGSVYVTVGPNSTEYPNSLVAVDNEGTVEWDVYVGDEPDPVAVAHDGSAVFVGIKDGGAGAAAVQEVDAETGDLGDIFFVGPALHAIDIETLPGSPGSVALVAAAVVDGEDVSRGIFVFDDGLQRNNIAPWQYNTSYSLVQPMYITVASDSLIYGLTGGRQDLATVAVHSNDLEITDNVQAAVPAARSDDFLVDIKYSSDMIFSMHGEVLDASGAPLGRCDLTIMDTFQAPLLPSEDGTIVYYVIWEYVDSRYVYDLLIYDVANFELTETIRVGSTERSPLHKPDPLDIVPWGDTGLAVLLTDRLVLVNNVR